MLSEEQLYYDAVNTKAEIWFQYRKHPEHRLNFYNYNDMNRSLSPRKRIDIANGSDLKGKMMAYYKKHNSQLPYFPDAGICIYTCDYEKTTSLNFMDYFGYTYEQVHGNLKLIKRNLDKNSKNEAKKEVDLLLSLNNNNKEKLSYFYF